MKLKTIAISGLKGLNRSFEFRDPSTVFIGENWAGKSAVLQAVQLALFGYVPGLGKTPAACMKLASSNELSVRATFEDAAGRDRSSSVTLTRRGASCSRKLDPPTLGTSDNMIDLAEWMTTGTSKDRASYVFGKCGLAPTPELFDNLKTVLEGVKRPAGEVPTEVWHNLKGVFSSAKSRATSGAITVPEFLDELTDAVAKAEAELKLDASRATSLALELGKSLALLEAVPDALTVETATFQFSCASGDLAEARAADSAHMEAEAELEGMLRELEEFDPARTAETLTELRAEEEKEGLELARRRQVEAERAQLSQRINKLKAEIALASRDRETAAKAQEEIERLQGLLAVRRQEMKAEQEKEVDEAAAETLDQHLGQIQQTIRVRDHVSNTLEKYVRKDLQKANEELLRLQVKDPDVTRCPCCGQTLPEAKMAEMTANRLSHLQSAQEVQRAAAAALQSKVEELERANAKLTELNGLTPELERKAAELKANHARIIELSRAIPYLETQLSRARSARVPSDTGALERELDELNLRLAVTLAPLPSHLCEEKLRGIKEQVRELEHQTARAAALTESATKARERVNRLSALAPGDERIAELEEKLRLADEALKLANDAKRIRMETTRARDEHAKAAARADEMTEAAKWVREVAKALGTTRKDLIEGSIGALLEKANMFLRTILTFRLEYRGGEFGYETEAGGWVSLDTLSGAERKLTFVAIQFALSAGEERGIVLLDELGTMTPGIILKVLVRMDELIAAGVISQFIGVLPGDGRDLNGAPCSIITVD